MTLRSPSTNPHLYHALLCIIGIITLIFSGIFLLKTSLHSIILVSIFWVILHCWLLDRDMGHIKKSMVSTLQQSASILLFFILIGSVIAAFTISGAIPTLIFYGLQFITVKSFLPIGMLLCSLMSLAIGSCWGTIGTMGVALMGIATILHIPAPITAGMIVSGAYFGDKFSPISDTTILSALTTETDLYKHIKGMTYSILPAYIITLGIFWILGAYYLVEIPTPLHELTSIRAIIATHFNTSIVSLLPIAILLSLSLLKKPAEISMIISVIIAIAIAIFLQNMSLTNALNSICSGPHITATGSTLVDSLLHHGGIQNMLSSMALALLVLVLGGLLDAYQFIHVVFSHILQRTKRIISLVFLTLVALVCCNMLMGEAYLSIVLSNRIFRKKYASMQLDSCVLSKAIEEGSTFSTPLIPWTTAGVFVSSTLGVHIGDYIQWSIFNWIAPVFFLILVRCNFAGIKMYKTEVPCHA